MKKKKTNGWHFVFHYFCGDDCVVDMHESMLGGFLFLLRR